MRTQPTHASCDQTPVDNNTSLNELSGQLSHLESSINAMNSAVAAITNAANTINTSFLRLNSLVQTAIMNPDVGVPVAPVKPSIGSNKFLYQQIQVLNNQLAVVEACSIQRCSSLSTGSFWHSFS